MYVETHDRASLQYNQNNCANYCWCDFRELQYRVRRIGCLLYYIETAFVRKSGFIYAYIFEIYAVCQFYILIL